MTEIGAIFPNLNYIVEGWVEGKGNSGNQGSLALLWPWPLPSLNTARAQRHLAGLSLLGTTAAAGNSSVQPAAHCLPAISLHQHPPVPAAS